MTDHLPIPPLPDVVIEPLVRLALTEDFGRGGDITTDAVIAVKVSILAQICILGGVPGYGELLPPV